MFNSCLRNASVTKYQNLIQQSTRLLHKSYYDVLKLKSNCSEKEIRDAFIKLSKECHPDLSKVQDAKTTEIYQNIVEAYRILSKPDSRILYDAEIATKHYYHGNGKIHRSESMNYHEPWKSYAHPNPKADSYYGFDGMKKIPNKYILFLIFSFTFVGVLLQTVAIKHSMTFRREVLDEHSEKASKDHATVRLEAQKYGNDEQLIRLSERILLARSSNNPSKDP